VQRPRLAIITTALASALVGTAAAQTPRTQRLANGLVKTMSVLAAEEHQEREP